MRNASNVTRPLTSAPSFMLAWMITMRRSTGSNKVIASTTALTSDLIRVDPLLAPLHGDPRFEALAEKIVPAREFAKPQLEVKSVISSPS